MRLSLRGGVTPRILFYILGVLLVTLVACDGTGSSSTIIEAPGPATDPVDPGPTEPDPVEPDPIELAVQVGEDIAVKLDRAATLSAEVLVDGTEVTADSMSWEQISGPGSASFSAPDALSTDVTFSNAGDYEVQFTASYQSISSSDSLLVAVSEPDVNSAPVVNAGEDATIEFAAVHTLSGSAADDGLPNGTLETNWSQLEGTGTATFGEVSQLDTSVSFSGDGLYKLQLVADDGELSAADTVDISVQAENTVSVSGAWESVVTSDGSEPQARHESAAIAYNSALYLFGGRGSRAVNRFDPVQRVWQDLGTPAGQLHHFQPVSHDGKIYVIGALDCCYPSESVIEHMQIFDPVATTWSQGDALPVDRLRGSAGTVKYQNKFYFLGGTTNGHSGGTVDWFDVYDPVDSSWTTLPDAPHKRDHFYAVVVGNRLYAIGGRLTGVGGNVFGNLVSEVDVFNFDSGEWETNIPDLPVPRAGAMVVVYNTYIVVLGGEMEEPGPASKRVDVLDTENGQWFQLPDMIDARHTGGAALIDQTLHVVSGSSTRGNAGEHNKHEQFVFQ